MKLSRAIVVLAALPTVLHAETHVTLQGGRVRVNATLAPMVEVLDRLGQSTGITIIYEGARPQQRLTLALEAATAAEAVLRVLEGQGLNYAMRFDASGTRVEMLLVSDTTPSQSSPKPASGPATTSAALAAVDDAPVEAPPQGPPERDAAAPEAGNPAGPGAAAPAENDFPAGFVNTPPRAHEGPPPADPSALPGAQAPPGSPPPGQTPGPQGVWPPRPGASPFGTSMPIPMPMPTPRPER